MKILNEIPAVEIHVYNIYKTVKKIKTVVKLKIKNDETKHFQLT